MTSGNKVTNSSQPCQRAEVILKVRSGLLTAVDAAKILGVSRKTYYKWENRGLSGLVNALDARRNGRPETLQEELEKQGLQEENLRLREQNASLQKQLGLKDKVHQLELDILTKGSSGKDTCNKKK